MPKVCILLIYLISTSTSISRYFVNIIIDIVSKLKAWYRSSTTVWTLLQQLSMMKLVGSRRTKLRFFAGLMPFPIVQPKSVKALTEKVSHSTAVLILDRLASWNELPSAKLCAEIAVDPRLHLPHNDSTTPIWPVYNTTITIIIIIIIIIIIASPLTIYIKRAQNDQ